MTIRSRDTEPTLRVTGMVAVETEWRITDFARLQRATSSEGWRAVRVGEIIALAAPEETAGYVSVESDDGHYRASIPRRELEDRGLLLYDHPETPLSREEGGPLRLIVPEGRTLCWNVKGVTELRCTESAEPDSVPQSPNH